MDDLVREKGQDRHIAITSAPPFHRHKMNNIDLNYRLVCKDCKVAPPNIVEDYKSGDLICGDCGLVFPMRIVTKISNIRNCLLNIVCKIDTRSEWRTFSNDNNTSGGADPSRVGAAENPLLDGVVDQLGTTISRF